MNEPDVASDNRAQQRDAGVVMDGGLASADVPPSEYGARLAWERQRADLGVTDVAASLRLHPNQVRALEQEDLARLPEPAYVRGFIRSYARILHIDAAPLLADLNGKLAPSASVVDAMTTTSDYSPVRAAAHERMSRRLVMGVALVGLVGLGFIGWLSTQRGESASAPVTSPPLQTAPPPAVEPPAQSEENTPATAASALDDVPSLASAELAADSKTLPILLLRFSGRSWVEVTDASGKILLSELIAAGAERELNGAAPLSVVIGDANVTAVNVHGEAFDLQPFTRNNVARFTVRAQ